MEKKCECGHKCGICHARHATHKVQYTDAAIARRSHFTKQTYLGVVCNDPACRHAALAQVGQTQGIANLQIVTDNFDCERLVDWW